MAYLVESGKFVGEEARDKFLAAARAAGAAIESLAKPNARGANGAELALDAARRYRRAEHLLIVCSGTHGEGFRRASRQVGLIKEVVKAARPQSVAALLAHGPCRYSPSDA